MRSRIGLRAPDVHRADWLRGGSSHPQIGDDVGRPAVLQARPGWRGARSDVQNVADILVEPKGSLHKETTAPPPRQEHLAVLRQPMPGFAVAELAPAFPEIRGSTGNERKVLLRPSLSKSVFT